MHPHAWADLKARSGLPKDLAETDRDSAPASRARILKEPSGPPDLDDVWLTAAQTRARCGNITNMCLWRWQRDPQVQFPSPDLVLNGRRYWRRGTIRRWQADRLAKVAV